MSGVGQVAPPVLPVACAPNRPADRHAAAAREFEALVTSQLVEATLEASGADMAGDPGAGQIWQGVLADAIGREIARAGGLGIASRVEAELRRADGRGGER